MKTDRIFLSLIAAGILFFLHCTQNAGNKSGSGAADAPEASAGPASVREAMKQAQKGVEAVQGEHANITPVPFQKLKELLPERLLNLPRTKHTGESAAALGMKFSTAEASYRAGAKRLNVKIVDAGGLGASTLSMAAWSSLEVNKEDDNGYERTSNWGEFKTLESCRTASKFCSLKLYSEKGIIAEIEGYDIPVADLKQVAEQIKLNSVAGMRE